MTFWLEGAGVGLILGLVFSLLGAGGGGLSVPALLYLLHAKLEVATGTALAIVCGAAVAGSIGHWRAGRVVVSAAVPVAVASVLGAIGGSLLEPLVAERWRLIGFVLALVASGVSMLRPRAEGTIEQKPMALTALIAMGLVLGVLTGFLGVGGGFLLVPVLTTLAHLPLKKAVGTSLAIIGLSSLTGAITHAAQGHVSVELLVPVGAGAIVGALLGSRLSGALPDRGLRVAFSVLVFAVAIAMFTRAMA